jgi:ligand-binding sensor domain-containing protein/two-component sensor histidine kinase
MKFIFFLFFCITLNCCAQSEANFPKLDFKVFTKNNQLPNPAVFSLAEDDDGLLWAGTTDGLARIDGYRIKNFFKNAANKDGLSDNTVTGLINFNGSIYTSSNEGSSYYDGKQKKFHQLDTLLSTTINKEFRVVFLKLQKQLLAFSPDKIFKIDTANNITSKSFTYSNTIVRKSILDKNALISATVDEKNNIWVSSVKCLMKINATTLIIEEIIDYDKLQVLGISGLQSLGGYIWISAFGEGIVRYNPTTKEVVKIKTTSPFFAKIVVFKDAANVTWLFAAGHNSYCVINPTTLVANCTNLDASSNAIYIDKKNTIWLGTSNGLYYFEQQKIYITNTSIKPNFSTAIDPNSLKDEHIKYFISTKNYYYQTLNSGNGAAQFDKNWQLIKSYPSNYGDTTRIAMGGINTIYEEGDYYWVCTWYKGLAKCTKDFKVIKWYHKQMTDMANEALEVRSFDPIGNNQFFVRSYATLAIFDATQEKYIQIWYDKKNKPRVLPEGLLSSAIMVGDDCYFGTERNGLYKINMTTGKYDPIPLQYGNLQITQIIHDDSLLWIGTSNGLVKYNLFTKESSTLLRTNGLCSDKVFRLQLSKKDNTLWLCTYGGVATVNTKTNAIKNFYKKDGLHDESSIYSLFIDDNNNILVSNGNYISFINPAIINQNDVQKKSVVTELFVNNENKDWLFNGSNKYIKLPYHKNNIGLHFTLESAAETDGYYYKLGNTWYTSPTGYVQFNNLAPGTYKIYVANQPKDAAINDFITITIRSPFYNTWWFYALCMFLFLAILYAFYKVKSSSIRKETLLQKTYEQKLADSEMQTLRSQMNPHFMFNTLNSINSYIIQNKTTVASEYLTTFSKLMRSILELSKQEAVTLAKEIATVKMYIELEALRLENKFDYTISIDQNVDEDNIKIPSLIIQPFVENAIWHGLHNKEGKGNISIKIKETAEFNLSIAIEDDGIGRKAAGVIKKEHTNHKSYGIDITINRVKLLNDKNSVTITDLCDKNNVAMGTRVTILLNIMSSDMA